MEAIQRIREAVNSGQVTLSQVSEASGLSVSGIHYIVQRPDRDVRSSTLRALELAAQRLLTQSEGREKTEENQRIEELALARVAEERGVDKDTVDKWLEETR
jgi:hypothetical protein